jgi:hypothetical protein
VYRPFEISARIVVLNLCLAVGGNAVAAEDLRLHNTSPEVEGSRNWYGWQIMLADFGVIAALAGGAALTSNSSAFAFVPITGGVGYFGGGPLVHVAHGNGERAVKSLMVRLVAPLGGASVGWGIGNLLDSAQHHRSDCAEGCARLALGIAGFGAGMLGAMVIDWVTAREPEPPATRSSAGEPIWAPVFVLGSRTRGAGIAIHF